MPPEALILLAALAFDLLFGEYPNRLHPVVWMGWTADRLLRWAPKTGSRRQTVYGAFVLAAVVSVFTVTAWLMLREFGTSGGVPHVMAGALVLKPAFAFRVLWREVDAVRKALAELDLNEARNRVGRIVSRDVAVLAPALVASAAVESAAESLTDSFVAPLLCFALFGPAAALAYRAVNTLDAMIGYHGTYEFLGKAAARVDDLLNLVPARIAGLLVVLSAGPAGGSVAGGFRVMWRDARRTESPNAGWTMSAMAGALGVRLEKPGTYVLNELGVEPQPSHIRQALVVVAGAAFLFVLATLLYLMGRDGGLS